MGNTVPGYSSSDLYAIPGDRFLTIGAQLASLQQRMQPMHQQYALAHSLTGRLVATTPLQPRHSAADIERVIRQLDAIVRTAC